ncbi:hypothetical protein [Pseudoalteromonas sp. TB64]|uniref:hypothetical protein n=1 Tax=Pseudoalteromonas sp. TB64 TaxID=1938600 RepID=UPI0003F8DE13|nr:hypothetical protein [Pseudoalteromonas sp. TB64]
MKKVEGFEGKADKINGHGTISYSLFVCNEGGLFVQLSENQIDTNSPGTFNNLLFPIAVYVREYNPNKAMNVEKGYCLKEQSYIRINNNNTSAFLKSVIRHLCIIEK